MLIHKRHCYAPRSKLTTPSGHPAQTCNMSEGCEKKNTSYSPTYSLNCLMTCPEGLIVTCVTLAKGKRLDIHAWSASLKSWGFLLVWSHMGQCTCCHGNNGRWPVKTVKHEDKNFIWEFWKVSQRRKRSSIGFVMSPAAAPATRNISKEIPLQSLQLCL